MSNESCSSKFTEKDESASSLKNQKDICESTKLEVEIKAMPPTELLQVPTENDESQYEEHSKNDSSPENVYSPASVSSQSDFKTTEHESFMPPDLNDLKTVLRKRAFCLPEDIGLEKLECDYMYPSVKRTKQETNYKSVQNINNENIPPESASQKRTSFQRAAEVLCRNNLMQVTLRTIALIKRNQQLQKELDKLKVEVAQFLQSVVSEPENNFSQIKENQ